MKNSGQIEATPTDKTKVILDIFDKIRRTQDIDKIFEVTTKEVRRLLCCDRLIVYQFNEDWSGQVMAEAVTSGWISLSMISCFV